MLGSFGALSKWLICLRGFAPPLLNILEKKPPDLYLLPFPAACEYDTVERPIKNKASNIYFFINAES